jgi:hypothetical protein
MPLVSNVSNVNSISQLIHCLTLLSKNNEDFPGFFRTFTIEDWQYNDQKKKDKILHRKLQIE